LFGKKKEEKKEEAEIPSSQYETLDEKKPETEVKKEEAPK